MDQSFFTAWRVFTKSGEIGFLVTIAMIFIIVAMASSV